MIRSDISRAFRGLVIGSIALVSASVMAGLDAAPAPAGDSATAQPVTIRSNLSLDFSAPETVAWQPLTTVRAAVARLESGKSAHRWTITAAGTEVSDRHGRRIASWGALTSREVRPQVVVDTARGAVWFYGEDLYRYRASSGELVRFRVARETPGAIRDVVADATGVWLATAKGVVKFDDKTELFSAIHHPLVTGQRAVQAAAADGAVWFVQEPARLIRLTPTGAGEVQLSASRRLPLGVVADMLAVRDTLWLLASRENGDHYELAYVARRGDTLQRLAGKYFSLREERGKLLATTHSLLFAIDPVTLAVSTARLDPARTLAQFTQNGSVLFVGSSYGVKDNCEVVEHRRVDISRGWMNPGLDLYTPVRSAANAVTN